MLKQMVRDGLVKLAATRDYHVIPGWQLNSYPQARYLQRLFQFFGISVVIDVGANRGQYRDFLRRDVGYDGEIISIEPIPTLASLLRERAESDPSWTVEECALGGAPGKALLNIMESDTFSSFLEPDHSDVGVFVEANQVASTVEVEKYTLDLIVDGIVSRDGGNIYLKLDTQGSDLDILKGGRASLRSVAALQTEASFRSIYRDQPGYEVVLDYLFAEGFVMSGAFPNTAGHFPILVEMDFHLVREDFIPESHRGRGTLTGN